MNKKFNNFRMKNIYNSNLIAKIFKYIIKLLYKLYQYINCKVIKLCSIYFSILPRLENLEYNNNHYVNTYNLLKIQNK